MSNQPHVLFVQVHNSIHEPYRFPDVFKMDCYCMSYKIVDLVPF